METAAQTKQKAVKGDQQAVRIVAKKEGAMGPANTLDSAQGIKSLPNSSIEAILVKEKCLTAKRMSLLAIFYSSN